jgi:hypothetical protein
MKMIVARINPNDGSIIDFVDWRDTSPLPLNIRLATPAEIAANSATPAATAIAQLLPHDADISRMLEMLVDVLLAKGVIAATDFPPAVRALYLARKSLRATAGF